MAEAWLRLARCDVGLDAERTITRLPDGRTVLAEHAEQPGQSETALDLHYPDARSMNRDHDVLHTLLAYWLGLPASPTLVQVADGNFGSDLARAEEAAVLALARFANLAGVDLQSVAVRAGA